MSNELDDIGIIGVMSKEQGGEIVTFCENMSEAIRSNLIAYSLEEKVPKGGRSLKQRNSNRRIPQFTKPYGQAPNHCFDRNTLQTYDKHIGIIKKIVVHTRLWDDRNCIKGL